MKILSHNNQFPSWKTCTGPHE